MAHLSWEKVDSWDSDIIWFLFCREKNNIFLKHDVI